MASIWQRSGGIWWIKYTDHTGRVIQSSLKTTDEVEAAWLKKTKERELAKIARGEALPQPPRKDIDAQGFWKKYEPLAKADNKRRPTLEKERTYWMEFLRFAKPSTLGAIDVGMCERFKVYLKSECRIPAPRRDGREPRKLKPLSDKTVNSALTHCGVVYSHAIRKGFVTGDNPFHKAARVKLNKRREEASFLTKEQYEKLLVEARNSSLDLYLAVALGVYAGLRRKEVDLARWAWVDFRRGVLVVPDEDGRFQSKNHKRREIPLCPPLRRILEEHRGDEEAYILNPAKMPGKWRYRWEFDRQYAAVLTRAGLSDVRGRSVGFHTLRHSFASALLKAGYPVFKVGRFMGHGSQEVTELYAHFIPHDEKIDGL